ncbi:MAG: ATP-binding protein [gamma proteobacterium symbiont of Taylorina sp.]|nr:ATP-binding protein [gamma proteobacterium symbiont of Taylorina sp.]
MAISDFNEQEFVEILKKYLSPAKPIGSIERLHGRSRALRDIEKALYADGRNVFIYGDRGVGKSSLAQTAANQYQSSDNKFILVECCPDSTFSSIIKSIARKAVNNSSERIEKITKTKISAKILSYESINKSISDNTLSSFDSIDHASDIIQYVSEIHSERPIVVIDEFDTIKSEEERNLFSSFLKHLGDKDIKTKFIFAGISQTLESLLGAHMSSIRQLETVRLERLSWDARWEIVDDVAKGLGLKIDRNLLIRIAGISDGFPYYVHLIAEKIMWHIFEKNNSCIEINIEDYYCGINKAIDSISPHLKHPYEKATLARDQQYHYVLWSMADAYDLQRNTNNIYKSYVQIMKEINEKALEKPAFLRRLSTLKQKSSEFILTGVYDRKGWYQFRESMVRGYVRLFAESNGIELRAETSDEPKMPTALGREKSSNRAHQSSTYPKGYWRSS